MGDIQKFSDSMHRKQTLIHYEPPMEHSAQAENSVHLGTAIARHWRAVLVTFMLGAAIGVPMIWFAVRPLYESVGAIRISPIVPNILFSDRESEQAIPNYLNFMNTQSDMVTSFQVLNRAADDLKSKNIALVGRDPFEFLRDSISNGTLIVEPAKKSELLRITMKSKNPKEAEQVVNAIIRAYMAVEVSISVKGGDEKLAVLEDEYRTLSDKLQRQRKAIRQMAEEFGTSALTGRQDMMLQQVTMLQSELTKIQTHRLAIETQIKLLEKAEEDSIPLDKVMAMRSQMINSDLQISALSTNIAQLEQNLIVANQTLTNENPEVKRRSELLETMKKRLKDREDELGKGFNDMLTKEASRNRDQKLKESRAELERTTAYEQKLLDMLSKHNGQTIELGRKQLSIQDQKEQMQLTEEMYNTIRRRIQELEMERKRPARISVAYNADSMLAKDKRGKLIAANVFGAAVLGMLLALLLDKLDRRVHTPEDITKHIGVRIIGTTIASDKIDNAILTERISDDYQTIRANLGMFNDEKIPQKLVITSSRAQEGKTTFSINLAISLAKAGNKILLIDGDMRKPDIAKLMNLDNSSNGVRRVLLGYCSLQECVWSVPAMGLDVLLSDGNDAYDAFELLTRPQTRQRLNAICAGYDNVIIDTPPVLAVPDALIWAKMADAVVLASYAGQTQGPDLQKALDRLGEIDIKILGTVLNSVHVGSSYNQYGYEYYQNGQPAKQRRRSILIPMDKEQADVTAKVS